LLLQVTGLFTGCLNATVCPVSLREPVLGGLLCLVSCHKSILRWRFDLGIKQFQPGLDSGLTGLFGKPVSFGIPPAHQVFVLQARSGCKYVVLCCGGIGEGGLLVGGRISQGAGHPLLGGGALSHGGTTCTPCATTRLTKRCAGSTAARSASTDSNSPNASASSC